jgi:hypothetical protein
LTARLWDVGADLAALLDPMPVYELRAAQVRARRIARAVGQELDRRMRQAGPEDQPELLPDQPELPRTFVERYVELRGAWDMAAGAAYAGVIDAQEALAGSADFEAFLIHCGPALYVLAAAVEGERLAAVLEAQKALDARSTAYVSGAPPPAGRP